MAGLLDIFLWNILALLMVNINVQNVRHSRVLAQSMPCSAPRLISLHDTSLELPHLCRISVCSLQGFEA